MNPPHYVSRQAELDRLCHQWRQAGVIAFDTEFIRDETYDADLCLLQVNVAGQIVLVDPLAGLDLGPFWQLVTDPDVLTIVHAGKEDFEVCLRQTGRTPRNVFDVQIAAGFVGLGYPLSLSRLVLAALGRRIAKAQTLTDWARRPLTDEQTRYAAEDVAHLLDLHSHLARELKRFGRREWAAQEFRSLEDPLLYRKPVQQRLFKLKGAKKLDGPGLAALERLIAWRDEWAQSRNRPIRTMIRDDVLVAIAKRRPSKARDLEIMRGFPHTRRSRITQQVLAILDEVRRLPPSQLPRPYEAHERSPMLKAVVSILSGYVRAVCHEEKLAHELVGSTQRIEELVDFLLGHRSEKPALLVGWRRRFIGRRLVALLEGKSELHLSGWPDDIRLEVVQHTDRRPAPRRTARGAGTPG